MRNGQTKKRNYSVMKLAEAMKLIGKESLNRWQLSASSRQPGDDLQAYLRRIEVFDLESTEQAKTLLMDALFVEIINDYPKLKIWKAEVLETDTLTGVADYLIAPRRAYLEAPLLFEAMSLQ